MNNAILFGVNDFAELLYYHLSKDPFLPKVQAFSVDRALMHQNTFCGLPVVAAEDMKLFFPPDEYGVYVCVGYSGMNAGRRQVFEKVLADNYTILSYISPTAIVDTKNFGFGNIVMQHVIIDAFTQVGNGNIFYADSMLAHHSTVGDFNFFAVKCCVAGHVKIKNGCFLGAHSTVKNNVTIADEVLIGANAYVNENIPAGSVIVPAKSKILPNKTSRELM